jgi:DnaJ-class molecular chaperone
MGGGGGGNGFGGFGDLFRGFGGFSMPVMMQLDITLDDLFNGKDISIPLRSSGGGIDTVKIKIEPGMMGGQQLLVKSQIQDGRGIARDVIFRLNELRHPTFQRRNADLLTSLKISLKDALLGFEKPLKHLDGKEIWIRSRKGDITAAEDILILNEMGMPIYGNKKSRGRLFIKISVEFPKKMWLENEEKDQLEKLLKSSPQSNLTKSRKKRPEEIVVNANIGGDISSFGHVGAQEAEEEDDGFTSHFFFR